PMSAADFFRHADNLALAGVVMCFDAKARSQVALLVIERGDTSFLLYEAFSGRRLEPTRRLVGFDDLPDFFAFRHEACPGGGKVLMLTLNMPAAEPLQSLNLVMGGVAPYIRYLAGQSEAIAEPYYPYGILPVRVSAGDRVKLSDIQTGLRLTGPD